MTFQNKYNLPVTGKVTYPDWSMLIDVYSKLLKSYPKEYSDYVDELYPDYFIGKGMNNDDVKRYQGFLLKICQYDKSIPGVKVTGVFDDLTERSVKKIQKDIGIEQNGLVGPITWKRTVELSKRKD